MDFDLSDEQRLLRDTTTRFIQETCPLSIVRALANDPVGVAPGWWRRAADLGWTSMLASADLAGTVLDLVVIAELCGANIQPGPLLPVNIVADTLSRRGTSMQKDHFLEPLIAGTGIATWCFAERGDRWDLNGITTTATPMGTAFNLEGTKLFVQDAHWSDVLLVTAQTPEGITQFLVDRDTPGVECRPMQCLDLARRLSVVCFHDVRISRAAVVGDVGNAAGDVERQLQLALVLQAAETVGAVDSIFSLTLDYARDRVAFGRPIGSYQAIKHRLADLYCTLEAMKATASAAAHAVHAISPQAPILTRVAKAFVGDTARSVVSECQQIFGGIGMTWEHDLHLYLRRVTTNAALYGSSVVQRRALHDLVSTDVV